MRIILLPIFNNRISTRLDCTDFFKVVKIENDEIKNTDNIKISSKNEFDRLHTILSINPNTVICNGLTDFYEAEFRKNNVDVIPWVYGEFNEVIEKFINGKLKK